MIKNKDIIIIGSIDWKTNWQTQHRLVNSLIKQNNRILYIENTGIRSAKFSDISRIKDRLNNWFKSVKGFKEIKKNLFIFSPIVFPFPFIKFFYLINLFFINFLLSNWFKSLNFKNHILISFLPTPISYKIKNFSNADLNIYYCANEMKGIQNKNIQIDKIEKLFFKESDITFVISNNLKTKASKFSKSVFFLPAGVELNKFNFKKIKKIIPVSGKPVIGYIGAITEVFDIDLLGFISKQNPNLNFILIGRVYADVTKLKKINNIFFLGEINHSKLPAYLKGFDVGIIPYKVNNFTNSVYSCKLNEYLSMGLPVVSTNLKETKIYNKNHKNIISIAKDYSKFSEKINENLLNNSQYKINDRVSAAKNNSWESRLKYFNHLLNDKIQQKQFKQNSWKSEFIKKYNNLFYTNIKKVLTVLIFFLIIFKSPLVPYLGNFLVVKNEIKNVNTMVVFSGDGESNYHNLSFQKRIIDIIKIKRKYPEIKVILTGRQAIFKESEIIRSLLISEGFNQEDIHVIKDDPYNTYENIQVVADYLRKENLKEVIFLTSPYHTLRSKLIWKKNFPEMNIIIPELNDSPKKEIQWGLNYSMIKIVIYEYLAIIYNRYKGWL